MGSVGRENINTYGLIFLYQVLSWASFIIKNTHTWVYSIKQNLKPIILDLSIANLRQCLDLAWKRCDKDIKKVLQRCFDCSFIAICKDCYCFLHMTCTFLDILRSEQTINIRQSIRSCQSHYKIVGTMWLIKLKSVAVLDLLWIFQGPDCTVLLDP